MLVTSQERGESREVIYCVYRNVCGYTNWFCGYVTRGEYRLNSARFQFIITSANHVASKGIDGHVISIRVLDRMGTLANF